MDLPDSLISSIAIGRGTILLSSLFKEIGHSKFFVIIGEGAEDLIGFFFINSDIHPHIMRKQAYLDLQYPIRSEDYPFLSHLSFVCASDVKRLKKSIVVDSITKGETSIKGMLHDEHLSEILALVRTSPLFSKADKHFFE